MRIGLVGAGPWARSTHGPALAAHAGVEFVGVWARRPDAAAALGAPVYDSYDALLADVDAVSFAVPPEVQGPMAVAAAEAGRHVLLDKPIAATLDDAERLADAVRQASVRSIVALTRRFAPETRAFLAAARGQDFSAGSGTWLSGAVLGGEYSLSEWRHRDGALFDVGPHIFDLLDVALGSITGVALSRWDRASDAWTIVLEHAGGAVSTSLMSLRTPVQPSLFRVELSGSDGVVSLADRSTSATDCFAVLLDELLESIESGTEHSCSVQRGLHLQKVLAHVHENT
ncbi:Gfo/Idh/MocA family protein [Rhodococcoides kyotonense]|uniref:Predicted dehydrogenase n=1 Tax=Rhodococcoides kyotonense TaxID=398843 RepID=A0A239F395_9NOCA|nr:Gfo/Idh/MocA family oxidoreductase [Rhodococcus kyotonensis]SNS51359.1 Predicted dehydrogenase [Rhodococcus kyotonensis]